MVWVLLLCSCVVPDDDSFSGGGTQDSPMGGGGNAGGNGGGGDDSVTDDSAEPTGCTLDDLEWSTMVQNHRESKPFYAGDTISFWGYVSNPCANTVSLELESTCLFDIVSLQPPTGALNVAHDVQPRAAPTDATPRNVM